MSRFLKLSGLAIIYYIFVGWVGGKNNTINNIIYFHSLIYSLLTDITYLAYSLLILLFFKIIKSLKMTLFTKIFSLLMFVAGSILPPKPLRKKAGQIKTP